MELKNTIEIAKEADEIFLKADESIIQHIKSLIKDNNRNIHEIPKKPINQDIPSKKNSVIPDISDGNYLSKY